MIRNIFIFAVCALAVPCLIRAEISTPQLPPNARVAIIGDSITEQKIYSKFIETYLLACTGRKDIKCFQFGWSGETAGGFAARAENDLGAFKPTVATTCYGMNDGGYQPFNDNIGSTYEKNMRNVIANLRSAGVLQIVIGSPGAVDTKFFASRTSFGDKNSATGYNDNLAHLRDIGQKLASENGIAFANVHDMMAGAMPKAKAALGGDYDVCGKDGFHPGPNGHLLMAAAFLKGLGLDGNIGEITVDMKGASSASEGHRVTGSNGIASVESTKWPFCFDGDVKASSGTRSILAFCKFNDELNRLILRVKNLDAAKATVTWGAESREFTREQLTRGINLAAEFMVTPFNDTFFILMNAVAAKQAHETAMIKSMVSNFRSFANDARLDAEFAGALETLKRKLLAKQEKLDAADRTILIPVKHAIRVDAAE